ncbi:MULTISPECIES: type II toxin-antitoxin system Phd/YefM family antitoxin [Burkholderiaceae]|uniref:type II toxin-antitoxin system Phd/YefM family antitoxin n=1 Tax=Burkholderiaceae TaxID=119060 RepID=UPI000958E5C3|nr:MULTISPECIES: type II toxin-antitoxin system Phd/YefM family antitoxin [Burkholderiaceae]SIT74112.1 prevent-host-death family protein [Burkholderia sp. b14]
MITEVNAVNFRQNLGEMFNQVQYRNDSIVINKDGKPVAALVDAELFTRIRRMQDCFDALSDRIAEAYAGIRLGLLEQHAWAHRCGLAPGRVGGGTVAPPLRREGPSSTAVA